MRRSINGFTIVELLIVIVVIAILAAISVVAYNGVQQRATNTQTEQALGSWLKALNLYRVDNSRWPSGYVCLGEGYAYGPAGSDSSGGQCRQTSTTNIGNESTSFNNTMRPYLGGKIATPAFVTTFNNSTSWWRGITYVYGGGTGNLVYVEASFAGSINPCPSPGGTVATSRSVFNGNTLCHYQIGLTTDT